MKPKHKDITLLDLDHPGANDRAYIKRRKFIAEQAGKFLYTKIENETWKAVSQKLETLHKQRASSIYLDAKKKLCISKNSIPQLEIISNHISSLNNFRLEPIGGLVDPRNFLTKLGERIMYCTRYVRHHSRPEYTPEPDIIHELIGHAPMFLNKEFTDFSQRLGIAASKANNSQLKMLENLYWYTIEFGLIREGNKIKAFGAGLLSSFGELENAFSGKPKWREFDIDEIGKTPYAFSEMQKVLFIIPSFKELKNKTESFLQKENL